MEMDLIERDQEQEAELRKLKFQLEQKAEQRMRDLYRNG